MQSTLISYQVTLIDIGETISMPLYRSEKFLLSQDASLLPPMAILCLVGKVRFHRKHSAILFFFFTICTFLQVDGVPANCLQRLLGAKRFHFEIVNICA